MVSVEMDTYSPVRYRSLKGISTPPNLLMPSAPSRFPLLRTPRFSIAPAEAPSSCSPVRQRWLQFQLPDLPRSPSPYRPLHRSRVSANLRELQEMQCCVTIALRRSTPKFLLTKRQRLWRDK